MCKVQHLGQHNPNINQNEGWMDWQQPVEKDLETIDENLDVSQQCVLAAQSHLHPGLYQKQCGQQVKGGSCAPLLHSWSSRIFQHKKNTDLLEGVQRSVSRMIWGLEHFSCEDRLRTLALFSPEKSKEHLAVDFLYIKGLVRKAVRDPSSSSSERKRGNRFELKEDRFVCLFVRFCFWT